MELEQAIKIINDFIKAMKPVFIVVNNNEINANLKKVEIEAFEIVLQALEKLQKENEKYRSGELLTANQVKSFEETTKKYYIHKDKIKEKIEELKEEDLEIHDADFEDIVIAKYEQRAVLSALEELLKGE